MIFLFFFFQIWIIDVKVVIASVASLLNNWFYILRNCTSFVLCKIPPDQCNNNLCLCPAIKHPQKRDKSIFHFLSSLHVSENMHNMHWYFASTSCFVLGFFSVNRSLKAFAGLIQWHEVCSTGWITWKLKLNL